MEDGSSLKAAHYQILDQQPIEIMQVLLTPEAFAGFLHGNVIKYALRCGHKHDPIKDMRKAAQYAQWYCEAAEGRIIRPEREELASAKHNNEGE